MVKQVTSLGRSGLHDWMIQRVSAVILAAYVIYLLVVLMTTPDMSWVDWRALFAGPVFKIFSLLAIFALVVHAWIGLWTVYTDYVKPAGLRMVLQILTILACLAMLLWGVQILWSL